MSSRAARRRLKNVTVTLDEETFAKARVRAAERNMSLSRLNTKRHIALGALASPFPSKARRNPIPSARSSMTALPCGLKMPPAGRPSDADVRRHEIG